MGGFATALDLENHLARNGRQSAMHGRFVVIIAACGLLVSCTTMTFCNKSVLGELCVEEEIIYTLCRPIPNSAAQDGRNLSFQVPSLAL